MEASYHVRETPLHEAAHEGHSAAIQTEMEFGATMEASWHNSETPLHEVAHEGHSETIPMLIDNGAIVNA